MPSTELMLGLLCAATAAACFDGAVVLQAAEARDVEHHHALRPSLIGRLVRRPRWLLGTAIAVLGWPLQMGAFALAPMTVVQPTLGVGLVLLLVLGARVLGEHVDRQAWLAAGAVIGGIAVLAWAAPEHTSELPTTLRMVVVGGVLTVTIALPFLRGPSRAGAWLLIISAGAAFAAAALAGKLAVTQLQNGRVVAAVAFGLLAAATSAVGFLVDMTALQRFASTRVAPPMFVLEILIPVACAPYLLREDWSGTPGGGVAIVAALAIVALGGLGLGRARPIAEMEAGVGDQGRRVGAASLARAAAEPHVPEDSVAPRACDRD